MRPAAAAVLVAVLCAGCGVKGPPRPPVKPGESTAPAPASGAPATGAPTPAPAAPTPPPAPADPATPPGTTR